MASAFFVALVTVFLAVPVHCTTTTTLNRRLLHQPFFPVDQALPPAKPPTFISQPPFPAPQPQPQPKYPFSSQSPPSSTPSSTSQPENNPFFPLYFSPPPPPPPPSSTLATFPANISSLILPQSPHHPSKSPISRKLIAVIASASLSASIVVVVGFFLIHHHHNRTINLHPPNKTDSLRLFPPDTTPSDSTTTTPIKRPKRPPPPPPPLPNLPRHRPTSTSSEFLYLGTLVNSREHPPPLPQDVTTTTTTQSCQSIPTPSVSLNYQRLGSPELLPLPPLPRQPSQEQPQNYINSQKQSFSRTKEDDEEFENYKNTLLSSSSPSSGEEDEFYSPRGSTGEKHSPHYTGTLFQQYSNPNSPDGSLSSSPSVVLNSTSPRSMQTKSPDSIVNFPAPPRCIPAPLGAVASFSTSPVSSPGNATTSPSRVSDFSVRSNIVPTPPPVPPPGFWEGGPPVLAGPTTRTVGHKKSMSATVEDKPKLKPLHWDKVRASSDHAMVWDQLKSNSSSSFQLDEEMIETLFTVNPSNMKEGTKRPMPAMNHGNQVLDPKKSQNIAILLRALNVTIEEVCEALLEGNADTLGTELLESLIKMAPTKEEEEKLKNFKDQSPFKLGPAEKFLKALLDIPFAFMRVDAMLYITCFDSEVEYLNRSFETLEAACKELRNSRMFLKLLEAVLKTGNRMNVGTNRGDAQAFKLDTLLKLVDVKGTDGKTTLLHFVVHEIIRAEGSRLCGVDQNLADDNNQQFTLRDEVEFRKTGLQVVSALSGELTNVKKAAAMDSDVLSSEAAKLAAGISKITEVTKLNEELALKDCNRKFSESMHGFLKKADEELVKIQTQERAALSKVKELTEYFHGNSAKEEAHPFRIFMVVRDFLSTLDQVCKDVGKLNERTIVSSVRQFPMPINPIHPQVFTGFDDRQQSTSTSDDDSSSSSRS